MDVDSQQSMLKNGHSQPPAPDLEPLQEHVPKEPTSVESFVSANEDAENAGDGVLDDDQATVPDPESSSRPATQDSNAEFAKFADENWRAEEGQNDKGVEEDEELEEDDENAKSPSDTSTPDKPLMRKSSLTFAALPAREPLTAKRSIGPRGSHLDAFGGARTSALGKSFGISQQTNSQPADDAEEHNKTSTQRLHERITLLGQQKEPRTSKSIHMPTYPSLPSHDNVTADAVPGDTQPLEDDDDDWIAPIRTSSRAASGVDTQKPSDAQSDPVEEAQPAFSGIPRPALRESPSKYFMGHHKSSSTATLASPAKASTTTHHAHHQKTTSVSNPNFTSAPGASTPVASPLASPTKQKFADAPLSASKAKLYSVLKSAKGMFGSSAAASAHAKMDSLNSPRPLSAATFERPDPDMSRMPGGLYPDLGQNRPATAVAASGGSRRTRSSTEHARKKDKESKEEQNAMDGLEKIRQQERQRAAEQKAERERAAETARLEKERLATASRAGAESQQSWRSTADEASEADEAGPPVPPKSNLPAGKLRAPGRLAKPSRLGSIQPKPAPVNIKVASGSQRLGSAQPGSSSQDQAPPTVTRQQATRSGSAQPPASSKAAPASNARVKALEAAARKKEQDEKAAQKKADQKREIERKRAAKAEEERKAEQERKAAEQQRLQEIRAAAQKQAEQRKLEQQRQLALQQKKSAELVSGTNLKQARPVLTEQAATLEQEKLDKQQAQATLPRGDIGGTLRQLAKQERPTVQANTAKAAKRPLQQESDDSSRPTLSRAPASYQQQGDKRRKTLEGDDDEADRPSDNALTAPPKRPSNMRKESTLNKFPHGYTHAPPPAAHHAQNSMFKATVTAQHHAQHAKSGMNPNDMMKLSTARIPFAENSNPPGNASSSKGPPPSAFKTPGRPAAQVVSKKSVAKSAKSSPMYANGDNINLPEIATDSEDEDSDDDQTGGFRAPSWVASPALRDLLTQQQLVDPESIFGPIAPLQMEEVFRNSKNPERLKKFRDRGSSARWVDTGDAVTKEEKLKDREMRARVVKEGGWRFGQDA